MNELKKTIARLMASTDVVSIGRRVCMFVLNEDPDQYDDERLEEIAIAHAFTLLERCYKGDFITSASDNTRALKVHVMRFGDYTSIYISWELSNKVTVLYSADCADNEEYEKEADILTSKL